METVVVPSWVLGALLAALGTAVMWMWNSMNRRMTACEQNILQRATAKELDSAVTGFTEALREHRKESRDAQDRILDRLDTLTNHILTH